MRGTTSATAGRVTLRAGALAGLIACLALFGSAPMIAAAPAAGPPAPPSTASPPLTSQSSASALTAEDVSAWLDGFMPYALRADDIAGAVVVVVKDDKLLVAKGYGYADVASRRPMDPQTSLVRIASITKLFTWTAVMQLVEAGKLDLDADVNRYLDFRIPPRDGKPVTLRELMTHTAGFEEQAKMLYAPDAARLTPLSRYARERLPRRIFPPGEVVAYSNYGAGLAGYIVQRVSGEPYETYVERHILIPLGMARTTPRQPLPAALAGDMATGYLLASGPPRGFEFDNIAPAGAMTTSGADIARFMIAHLDDGRLGAVQILSPGAAERMHATAFRTLPTMNGMALGFFETDRNGHRVLSHDGDLTDFHSDLQLVMDQHVGLFVAMNSRGSGSANETIRLQLFRDFLDRYFPAPNPGLPRLATAVADGRRVAGEYVLSRRSETTVLTGANIALQAAIEPDEHGDLHAPVLDQLLGSPPRVWREVAPMTWQETGGRSRLAAELRDGRVVAVTTDDFPAGAVLQPAPFAWRQSIVAPALGAALLVLVTSVLAWPIGALVRRHYGGRFRLTGARASVYRLSRAGAVAQVLFIPAWFALVLGVFGDTAGGDPKLDLWFRGLQLVALAGLVGAAAAAADLARVWRDRSHGWWARSASMLIVVAMAIVIWAQLSINAFNPSLIY